MWETPSETMQETDDIKKWNSLIQYWAEHDFEKLPLHHQEMAAAFFLDAEVQNGGFDQYFFNQGFRQVAAVRKAMRDLGAEAQLSLLEQAVQRVEVDHGPIDNLSFEQAREIEELELDDLDSEYYRISPALTDLLEAEVLRNYERYQPGL